MKKLFLGMAAVALLLTACDDNESTSIQEQEIDMSDFYVYTDADVDEAARSAQTKGESKSCYTMVNLNRLLNEDSGLEKRMYNIEYNTRAFIAARKPDNPGGGNGGGSDGGGGGGTGTDGIIPYGNFSGNTIPVIFHVIYSASSENISDSQITDQIAALDVDFSASNTNGTIPDVFTDRVADLGVNFELAGVIRKQNKKKKSWRPDDSMKFSSSGGSDVIDPEHYLNIWVVNNMPYQGGTILGYAQFPGGSWSTDGIVLGSRFVGNTSYSTGRTATHEIGHWMNLRHIWGDGPCGRDDMVSDTPEADSYNSGCPSYPGPTSCGSADMFMNFMDYTSDTCMNLFTDGQKARMAAQFNDQSSFRNEMGITIN